MAKVEISVDTSKKDVVVKVDGKKFGNVSDVWVHAGEWFSLDISQREEAGDDLAKVTRLVASVEDEEFKEAEAGINHQDLRAALKLRTAE